MTGITPTGFDRKRLDDILSDLQTQFKLTFGDNLNVSAESADGQVLGILSAGLSELWELAEGGYDAFNPSIAVADTLSNLVQLNGIFRQPAVASTAMLTITGVPFSGIPRGALVSASDGSSTFTNLSGIPIPFSGTVDREFVCTVTGPTVAVAGSLTVIDTPITGWTSVVNNEDAVVGADEESDADLRARRERSVARAAKNTLETILTEVLDQPAVDEAFIYENTTLAVDPTTSTPGKAFQVVVLGGADDDIAQAIFDEKPVGIEAFGTTVVQIIDSQGVGHPIGFTRPVEIPIYVTVNINTFDNFPPDGADIIKQAIVDYANGDLITGRGFTVADDVINSELYCPVNTVSDQSITSILQGTAPAPGSSADISIAFNEISTFDISNIVVVETPV